MRGAEDLPESLLETLESRQNIAHILFVFGQPQEGRVIIHFHHKHVLMFIPKLSFGRHSRRHFVAAATAMPAPPAQRRRSVEPCLAELIDGLKLKPAQAESLEQLLDEHEVHDLATAQILDAEDFKEIGIKVGTRKKLLERLASSTSEA